MERSEKELTSLKKEGETLQKVRKTIKSQKSI